MAKKAAPKKKAPAKPKPVKIGGRPPTNLFKKGNGEPPVIVDDGGSTRIKQVMSNLDGLLANSATPGTAIVNSPLAAATIRYFFLDKSGNPQPSGPMPITGTIDHIDVITDTAISVTVIVGANSTQLTLMNGVTVTAEDAKKTKQRSYIGNDTGAISMIVVTGTDGSTASSTPAKTAVYTMLHLKF
jgi:hypothetical protein